MYQASAQFNNAILGNQRTFRAKIAADENEATSGFLSIKQYSRSTAEDYISIGDVVSSYVEIQMYDPGFGLENSEIEVSIGMLLDGEVEYIPLGLFTVKKPQNDDGVVTFTAYDRIQSRLSGAFFSELSYPADGKTVLQEISEKTGVPIDVSNLPDGVMIPKRAVVSETGVDDEGNQITTTTYTAPFDGYLYREALGYIAQLYCKFATVNRSGTVELRWYTDADYTVSVDRYYDDLVTNEQVFSIGAITCTVGDTLLTVGTGTESIRLENPVMTQKQLNAIYEEIKTLQFLPAGLSFYGDMRLEPGDIVTISDKVENIIRLPVMNIFQDFDGGLLTEIQSFGRTEQEASAAKGPTAQKLDRVYTELFLVKELVGNKASFDYVHGKIGDFDEFKAKVATIENTYIDMAQVNTLLANYATIDLANVQAGAIKTAMIDVGAIQSAQIADGAITNLKVAGDLDATKITVGTLSVDRLIIRGSEKSLVYELNNITGALQAQSVDTLNGEILTPRTITADKVVANSITGNEIAAKTITANNIVANSITGDEIAANSIKAINIDVANLFAQDITATGTIKGLNLVGATGSFTGSVSATLFDINGSTLSVKEREFYYTRYYYLSGSSVSPIEIGGTDKFFVLDSGLRIYAANAEFGDLCAESINSTELGADSICGMTIYANSFVEGDTAISSKYAPFYHDHSYLPLSGGLMTGGIQLPNTGGTWVHGMTETKCIVGTPYTSSAGRTYHPILRQNTALGNVFNLGGITISSADDRFGLYVFKSGRTENGYDYGTYLNAVDGTLHHTGGMYISGGKITIQATAGEAQANVANSLHSGRLVASGSGYFGLYDATYSKWIVRSDASGNVALPVCAIPGIALDNNGAYMYGENNSGNILFRYRATASAGYSYTNLASIINLLNNKLSLSGGTVTGEFKFADYAGTNRRPVSSATTDGSRVSYVTSKTRSTDSAKYVTIQGQYGTTGSTYNAYNYLSTTSDKRLKTNIIPTAAEALSAINKIQVRQFDWIDTGIHQPLGLVADEIELIDPRFVFGGGYNEDGSMNVKGIDTLTLSAYLVKGIQELYAIDTEQDKRLSALEIKWQIHESCMESLRYQNSDIRNELSELRTENAALRAELAQLRAMIAA